MKVRKYKHQFFENDVEIQAEKHTLVELARALREAQVEGTLSDLAYQIEYAFDIDGVRSLDDCCPFGGDKANDCADCIYSGDYHYENGECVRREEYVPSAENGDYGPSNPWDAPGMSVKDFI